MSFCDRLRWPGSCTQAPSRPLPPSLSRYHTATFFSVFLCSFWRSKFSQGSTDAVCSWDHKFTPKWIFCCHNSSCDCVESPSTVAFINSTEKKVYLFWNHHFVLRYKWMVEAFYTSEQNKLHQQTQYAFSHHLDLSSQCATIKKKTICAVVKKVGY